MTPSVEEVVDPLAGLIAMARQREDIDLIYVNDNYGDFTADHDDLVRQALKGARPGLVEPLLPRDGELFLERSGTAPSTRDIAGLSVALARTQPTDPDADLGKAAPRRMQENMRAEIMPADKCLG